MKMKVMDEGVTTPKRLLEGAKEGGVHKEGNRLIVIPLLAEDPIWALGSDPVTCGVPDASSQPDRYLYGPAE